MSIPDLRAELTRLQAAVLQADEELNATPPGTKAYGERRDRRQLLGNDLHHAKQRLQAAIQAQGRGTQPLLL